MNLFVSHHALRLDAKGRLSVPAAFRAVLAAEQASGLYCYPALDRPAIDAGGQALLKDIDQLIASFPPYSEEREQLTTALYGTSDTLKMDAEGRIVLPDTLKDYAFIRGQAVFVGLGRKFQIWEPDRFRAHLSEATATVRTLTRQFGSRMAAQLAHGARE